MFGQGHYIKPNEGNRVPRRHVVIDAEAREARSGKLAKQSWRCAVASFMVFRDDGTWKIETREYTDPVRLWADVDAFTRVKRRTVVWAHNVAYDLRVTGALAALDARGWDLEDIRLRAQGTWGRWRRDGRSLVAVDSASVWPVRLEDLGKALGLAKPALPAGDEVEPWLARCRADVLILATAVGLYLDWLREDDMGNWSVTGAGQSMAAWRHKFMDHKVLVADDLGARDAERRAMWTGRCEAWRYGGDAKAKVVDLDFRYAYANIAASEGVPVKQVGETGPCDGERLVTLSRSFAVLADVEVTTEVPVVPCEREGLIVWPVGTFRTVLWDPEIRLAVEAGAQVKASRVWLYRRRPALARWGEWIISELEAPDSEVPAWRKIILKHWSRTLIGRFAMRYTSWDQVGESAVSDIALSTGQDGDTGEEITYMQVGRRVFEPAPPADAHDCVPAITGYVMSIARVRLWRAAVAIGEDHVLYMDTDSLLVTVPGYRRFHQLGPDAFEGDLRVKRRCTGWLIAGPRQLVVGDGPRISGVPKRAQRIGEWTWEGEVWRGFGESIRLGEHDSVMVKSRVFHVHRVDHRRSHEPDGRTRPYRAPGGDDSSGTCWE